jgi:hypothetical protein
MASLEKRPHGFRVVFMFRGEKHARSLQTKDPKQAKSTLARMTVSDLQGFIEKRSKEKGIHGNVTATTIKKALVTFARSGAGA